MSSKYYSKPKRVRAHTRRDPRINKRVSVDSYTRNQRYRNYKGISREQALKLFNQRSNRARAIDLSRTSKNVLEKPNEYWLENIGRSDVKGIDTKITEYTEKGKLVKELKNNIEKAKKLKDQIIKSKDYTEKEELREKLNQLQKKHEKLVEDLREFEEKEIAERREELGKKRKGTLQEDIKKIQEIREKFRKNIRGKAEKERWDKQKIEQFGDYNDLGIIDSNKITLLTTNQQFEGSMIDKHAKNRKQVKFDLDKTKFILTDNGGLYEFDDKKLCGYDKQYFERAIKSLRNPKIYYEPKKPLIIQGDTFTYAIAPRDYEPDLDPYDAFYDDDDWEIMKKNKNELKTHEIKLNPKQYKKLMSYKKSDLLDKYYEIQRDYDILIDTSYKPEKAQKHELLYRLLHKIQEIPEKKKEREKFAKDIGNLAIKKIESRYKPKKAKSRYYLASRPYSIGTVPKEDKVIQKENWGKLKDVPKEKISAYGWVEYPENLSFKEIDQFDLVPEDNVEWANYMFWYKLDKNQEEANKIKKKYLGLSLEELKKNSERDPFCRYAYLIKKNLN